MSRGKNRRPEASPVQIRSREHLVEVLATAVGRHYVYLLCYPGGGADRPFYVGLGREARLFAHEDDARDPIRTGSKVDVIREIWANGGEVLRFIDSFHSAEPFEREAQLISLHGLLKDGTGKLANEQRYAPGYRTGVVMLRKYAAHGNELPSNFVARDLKLCVGPQRPKSTASVYGKICAMLENHPGATGAQLVELLLEVDFSGIKSAYAQGGNVSRPWLAKYIDGGFYAKNRCIQKYLAR